MSFTGLAAVDDRAVAGRARQIARGAGQAFFLDQFDPMPSPGGMMVTASVASARP
jgi:hypothetical protein